MQAGRLDQRVQLQRPVRARDGYGAEPAGWEDVAQVWATVVPVSGRERITAPQVMAEDSIRVHLRLLAAPELDETWRLVHGGRPYRIEGVARYPREGRLELSCSHAAAGPAA